MHKHIYFIAINRYNVPKDFNNNNNNNFILLMDYSELYLFVFVIFIVI